MWFGWDRGCSLLARERASSPLAEELAEWAARNKRGRQAAAFVTEKRATLCCEVRKYRPPS
eukprot:scaffold83984_cov36-Phaeocystis_antarctica.AAC.1